MNAHKLTDLNFAFSPHGLLLPKEQNRPSSSSSFSFGELHPWCAPFKIRPAKHHYPLALGALSGIFDILGDRVCEIEDLRIVTLRGALKVYLSLKTNFRLGRYTGYGSPLDDYLKAIEQISILPNLPASLDTALVSKLVAEMIESEDISFPPSGPNKTASVDKIVSEEPSPPPEPANVVSVDYLMTLLNQPRDPYVRIVPFRSIESLRKLIASGDHEKKGRLTTTLERLLADCREPKKLALVSGAQTLDSLATERFPNFSELFDYLRSQFTLAALGNSAFRLPPILLIGEPGIGKTEILMRISKILNTGFLPIDMASSQTAMPLSGSEIHWSNSRHGSLFELLAFGATANPMVMLDEIDKVQKTQGYDPLSPLYSLLERRTAARFVDLSMPGVFFDASHVVWFASGNSERHIEPAILSRFKLFHIPAPTRQQMPTIAKSVYSDLLARETWGKAFSPSLSDQVLNALGLIAPRHTRKVLESACANAAKSGRREILTSDIESDRKVDRMGF